MKLTAAGCRERQHRLLERLASVGVENAVLGDPKHVLYLTGFQTEATQSSAVVMMDEGRCLLVAPPGCEDPAVDDLVTYEPSTFYTVRLDQPCIIAQRVSSILGARRGRLGLDKGGSSGFLGELMQGALDLEPELIDLRRKKDDDEVAILKRAIDITQSCYARAVEILEPGISELEVYTELYRTAVVAAGERLPAMGNDFQCNSPGGPPRLRRTEAGELYILDLGVQLSGYFADNSRTFCIGGEPTEVQQRAWNDIVQVFCLIEEKVRPGVPCKKLFEEVKELLDAGWPGCFFHHLGHGVGLSPQERPNLNPFWNHIFREGDFFTVEPGLYQPELRRGIRLEENYLVTAEGVEKLTSFPLRM